MGGPGYTIPGEFSQNGFKNDLRHTEGVLSMARAMHPLHSAGSQFFIMHKNAPHLDGAYAAFGKRHRGHGYRKIQIADVPTDFRDRPMKEQKIKSMTVDTFGVDYPEPKQSMKLLYAEDEPTMAEAVVDILTYHNYLVDAVSDGEDALSYALSETYSTASSSTS